VVSVSSAILTSGCGKTVLITRGPQITAPPVTVEPVDGIPFYVKRAYCQQQASWLEPQFTLDIAATVDGKRDSSLGAEVMLSRAEFLKNHDLRELKAISGQELQVKTMDDCRTYISALGEIDGLRRIKMDVVDDADLGPAISGGDVLLTENTAQIVPYVDYETVYYYNTARPLTGTSQVDVHLAADGTLTEGNSSVNDQTLSTVTGVLSTAITSFGPAAMTSSGLESELPEPCKDFKGKTLRYDVTNTVEVYRHTHTFKTASANEIACVARPVKASAVCGDGCSLEITEVAQQKPEADKNPAKPSGDKPDGDKPTPGGDKPPAAKP
jgi:hypothetical protein